MILMLREYGAPDEVPDGDGKISRNLFRKGARVFVALSFIVRAERRRLRRIAMPTLDASTPRDEMRGRGDGPPASRGASHAPSAPE